MESYVADVLVVLSKFNPLLTEGIAFYLNSKAKGGKINKNKYYLLWLQLTVSHPTKLSPQPAKILSPFLSTAPLQYVPKTQFTPAPIDCLTTNETKNALHNGTVSYTHLTLPTTPYV